MAFYMLYQNGKISFWYLNDAIIEFIQLVNWT